MSNPLADMDKPDVIFCIGTNMTECHPVAATALKKAVAAGAKLIVVDPRHIDLAKGADIYLPIRVGSDTALLLAMAHVIAREGLVNQAFPGDALEAEVLGIAARMAEFSPAALAVNKRFVYTALEHQGARAIVRTGGDLQAGPHLQSFTGSSAELSEEIRSHQRKQQEDSA